MMKLITICVVAACFALAGCNKKTDEVFSETPDARLEKALQAYKNALMQAPGWKLFVYPEGLQSLDIEVGGLTYYIQFPDSNRVNMVSDFNVEMATVPKESGYHLKATQRPSVVFDTYSYIHVAADPDETVSFSPAQSGGYGWGTDFDFAFRDAEPRGDTLFLEGNFNHSDAYMIKATAEEMQQAFNGRLGQIVENTNDFSSDNSFLFFNASDNSKIGVTFNTFLFRINFTYLGNGQLLSTSVPYSHTTYGVHFKTPVSIGGYTFQDMFWDDAQQLYYIETPSGRVNITESDTPLFPLDSVLGKYIISVIVPTTPLPGQSPTFANVYDDIKFNLKSSGFDLDLQEINFMFDDASKTMAMLVFVDQFGVSYVAAYQYAYNFNSSGVTRFIRVQQNGNAELVEQDLAPLLDYIDNDSFKLDYYTQSTPILGQFTSQQNPAFFFTGNLE
jgi:hypothetical protein